MIHMRMTVLRHLGEKSLAICLRQSCSHANRGLERPPRRFPRERGVRGEREETGDIGAMGDAGGERAGSSDAGMRARASSAPDIVDMTDTPESPGP